MTTRLHRKVEELLNELYQMTGENISWYVDKHERPYPIDDYEYAITNRHVLPSRFLLTMGEVRDIKREGKKLYVISPKKIGKGYSPDYDNIEVLSRKHKMFRNSDKKYGEFKSVDKKKVKYYDTLACSGRECYPWIIVKDGLDKFLEKVLYRTEDNIKKINKKTQQKTRKERLRKRELTPYIDSSEIPESPESPESPEYEEIIIKKKKKKQSKKKIKSKKKEKTDSNDGLIPTVLLGGILGVFAVLFTMK